VLAQASLVGAGFGNQANINLLLTNGRDEPYKSNKRETSMETYATLLNKRFFYSLWISVKTGPLTGQQMPERDFKPRFLLKQSRAVEC
jgi:hypothetical protein